MYTVDDDLSEMDVKDIKYEEYWDEVVKSKDGDWERYEMLPRSRDSFNSNSETERAFSVQTDIHINNCKNSYNLLRREEEENSQEETELNDKQKRARKTWKEDGRS